MMQNFCTVNDLILEELGISNEMLAIANDVCGDIEKAVKEKFDKINVKKELKGCVINIWAYINRFKTQSEYDEYLSLNPYKGDSYSVYVKKKSIWISINIDIVSGYFNKPKYTDIVYHEIEHAYQQISMRKEYSYSKQYQVSMKYWHSPNPIQRAVSSIIYLSFKYEQDAFANGLYSFLFSNYAFGNRVGEVAKESEAWKKCEVLRHSLEIVKANLDSDELSENLKEYGITLEKLLKIGETSLRNMYRKIGRTIIKYRNDMDLKTHVRVNENFNSNSYTKYFI